MATAVYRQLQIRRDILANIPILNEGELFFATDTIQLWIGTAGGTNILMAIQI
jgi:Major tropism determinant N-terminal domain